MAMFNSSRRLFARPEFSIELPEGLTMDDGYTHFEARNHRTADHNKYTNSWSLHSRLRVLGKLPPYSGFRVVVQKDGKTLSDAKYQCRPATTGAQPLMGLLWSYDDKQKMTTTGEHKVLVYVTKGDDNSEHLARTYTINIAPIARIEGMGSYLMKMPPEYIISQHSEVLSTIIFQRTAGWRQYVAPESASDMAYNFVELLMTHSPSEEGKSFNTAICRFKVNGKTVFKEQNGVPQDRTNSTQIDFQVALHTDRNAPQYHRGAAYKEEIAFKRTSIFLPLSWGTGDMVQRDFIHLKDHPGNWEVEFSHQGKPIRTWKFVVDKEGIIQPHPEQIAAQKAGKFGLMPGASLVETIIPPGGSYADARVVPSAVTGLFYGLPFTTPETKAMVAKLPKKSTAWPVAS
jgi:hypothetical protein